MKNKKNIIIGSVVIALAVIVLFVSRYYPPSKGEDASGTIGVVKKYNAGQISEKDVKLKNVMLSDIAAVNKSVIQLKDYKLFVECLSKDLGTWNTTIENAKKDKAKNLKEEKLLLDNQKNYAGFKTYIDKNIVNVDNTINLLTKISKGDTVNQNLEIEKTLSEYENFRIQVMQKFSTVMASLPNVHNAFVKNGMNGMIGNKENALGMIRNKDNQLGAMDSRQTVFNSNMTLCVVMYSKADAGSSLQCCSRENINSATLCNSMILYGNYTAKNGSLNAVNNKETNSALVSNRSNEIGPLSAVAGSLGLVLNKDNQLGMCALPNKSGELGIF